jgi:hypothetical protein
MKDLEEIIRDIDYHVMGSTYFTLKMETWKVLREKILERVDERKECQGCGKITRNKVSLCGKCSLNIQIEARYKK